MDITTSIMNISHGLINMAGCLMGFVNFGVAAEDPAALSETFGRVNRDFSGFLITRPAEDDKGNVIFKFAVPPEGIESDSKQHMQGVFILIDAEGNIVRVKPEVSKLRLPDQKAVNNSVDSGEEISKFLEKNEAENQTDIHFYGLLNKWATAVLVRTGSTVPKFDPTEKQRAIMESLFKDEVKVPAVSESSSIERIDSFAKAIIRFSPY